MTGSARELATPDGTSMTEQCDSQRAAAAIVARSAHSGLRFHDLRHSYATWLISDAVPINDVQRVMGHELGSATLNMYTRAASEQGRYGQKSGRWGAWMDSDMQGGPIDELLYVAVERPALDQLQVEVGSTLEDRVESGPAGDDREERHLQAVDQAGG